MDLIAMSRFNFMYFMAIGILKAYRVSRVFAGGKMLRAVKITDKMLMAMLIKCAIIEGVLHELFGGKILYYNHEKLRIENHCNFKGFFKDSTCVYFSSFLSLLCTLIVLVFSMATDDHTFLVATQSFAIISVAGAVSQAECHLIHLILQ